MDTYYKKKTGHFNEGTAEKVASLMSATLMRFRDLWQDFDWTLFGAILVLSAISLIEIYSATKNSPVEHNAAFRQLVWVLHRNRLALCCGGIGLSHHFRTDSLAVSGRHWCAGIHAGVRQNRVGFQKLDRHRSDAASAVGTGKDFVIVAVARYLSELRNVRYLNLEQIVKARLICGIPVALVALQPDLGTTITFLPISVWDCLCGA